MSIRNTTYTFDVLEKNILGILSNKKCFKRYIKGNEGSFKNKPLHIN